MRNVEVNPKGVTKATGLQSVCDSLGLINSDIIAIGDGLNDLSMMAWAGVAIAMGNALTEVKAVATWVTDECIEDGVARAIQSILGHDCATV